MKRVFTTIFTILFALQMSAQLVSVEELSKMIKDPNLIVIDARPAGDYLKTHIDGAINIDAVSLSSNTPTEGALKTVAEMAAIFGSNGVTPDKKIVIYCKTGVSAGRMYWVMKHIGFKDVSLLDGNMQGWFAARKPITKNPKKLSAATFTPAVNSSILASKDYVKSKINSSGTVLVDSRIATDYEAGKIGNAISIPSENLSVNSKLKSVADLTAIFSSVPKDKEVIVYCKTGVTGSFTYFVLTSVLKYPNVKLYAGSYSDWTH
jgi:thiosulfate/3-mercaptopyruvate sulfurtransferase